MCIYDWVQKTSNRIYTFMYMLFIINYSDLFWVIIIVLDLL